MVSGLSLWLGTAPFIAATLALTGVWLTMRQKERADRRAEWWRRATWAIERTADDDVSTAEIGEAVLNTLLVSPLVTASERDLIEAIALAKLPAGGDDGDDAPPMDEE